MIKDNYLDVKKIVDDRKIMRLFLVVKAYGGVLRFVGGCVRDALMGIEGFDVDLATDLSPDELVEACDEEGLITKPIGISHGTVGVILNGEMFEVTSLRKDIKTDGRHAEVEYTDDWDADAARRDLTINAVYADEKGNVYDYFNGLSDLENGVVKFIGNPETRVKEDYLRILRFFRFYAMFGKTSIDKKALKACVENKEGLSKISNERISMELKKLFKSKNPEIAMKLMFDNGILDKILPQASNFDVLEKIKKFSDKPMLRLFALYLPDESLASNLAYILKMSAKEKEAFVALALIKVEAKEILDENLLKKNIYLYGKDVLKEHILLKIAQNKLDANIKDDLFIKIDAFEIPEFIVKGTDVIAAGVAPGVEVKNSLKKLEKIWIDSNFSLSKKDLLINL